MKNSMISYQIKRLRVRLRKLENRFIGKGVVVMVLPHHLDQGYSLEEGKMIMRYWRRGFEVRIFPERASV